MKTHSEEKPNSCQVCNKVPMTWVYQQVEILIKPFNLYFLTRNLCSLWIWRGVHTGEKPYHCQFCDKVRTYFFINSKFKKLLLSFCWFVPFEIYWNRLLTFSQSGSMRDHERAIHLKEKPYKCSVCSKVNIISPFLYRIIAFKNKLLLFCN